MAMIECPECGRDVSSSATFCPECGYPLKRRRQVESNPNTPPAWRSILPGVFQVLVGSLLVFGGAVEEEVSGVIGGLFITVTAIPMWYRNKLERLRGGVSSAEIDDRMMETEQRLQAQLDQADESYAQRIADLEERLDFTERLLTKPTERE